MTQVKEGSTVSVHYTGKLTDGSIFDSSEGREPLTFKIGEGSLIKGFEQGVMGMKVDESKTVNIPAAEAYGDVREDLFIEVPKTQLPPDLKIEEGMDLISQQPDGQQMVVKINEIKPEAIVIDANHKLAGKDLIFEIKVTEIA
jgi:FKBP-type peptidyl-prolyl cis-trans isomerase 2